MRDEDVTEDALLGGAVRLLQVRTGHRAGTDAVLLAALGGARDGDRVVDLGAASGAVGLMAAARARVAHVTFVDRDPGLVELCRRNAELNGHANKADAIVADALAAGWPDGLERGGADLVLTNPPFFDAASPASPDARRRAAHRMDEGGLPAWIAFASALLGHRGRLALIHRPDALGSCLQALGPAFGSIEIVPVHPRADKPAGRIVLRAVKGGRAPLQLRPALVLHGPGGMTREAAVLHGSPPREDVP